MICGYSAGSLIAQQYGLLYPERVTFMILVGAYPEVDS